MINQIQTFLRSSSKSFIIYPKVQPDPGFTRGYLNWEIDAVAVDLRWSKMDEYGLYEMVLGGFDISVEPKVLGIETNHMGWIYLLALVGGMGAMDLSLTHLRHCLF